MIWPSILMIVAIVILSFASLLIGAAGLTLQDVFARDHLALLLMIESRVPRLLAIICTGAGMSVAGLLMQNLCANKFVSPSTSSTIASAQFGVMLSLVVFTNATLLERTLLAFVCSLVGTWIFIYFIQKIKFKDVVMVPLIGITLSLIIGSVTTHFALYYEVNQGLQSTFVGSFALIMRGDYEIVFLVIPMLIIAYLYANHFNIVGLGENLSSSLGVNYQLIMFFGLSVAAMLTASVVVTVGTISYLGLIVPNVVAMFRGDKIRGSMLDVILFGILFVLVCDILCRVVIAPYELPVNLATGVIGSIVFLALLYQRITLNKTKKKREKFALKKNEEGSGV